MFYVTLNKHNPRDISQHTPQHARAHYCSTERSFSKTLLALVAADTQGHAASCTNQVLASTLHQPFGLVSTPSFFAVHYFDRSRSPTMVTILLVYYVCTRVQATRTEVHRMYSKFVTTCWVGSDDLWAEKGITSSLQEIGDYIIRTH